MQLAFLQHADRALNAINGARSYVTRLVEKVTSAADAAALPASEPELADQTPEAVAVLSSDVMAHILSFLDANTLVAVVPIVCKQWRAEAASPALWRARLSPKQLELLEALAALGKPVGAAHLYLALRGRNFLRNPAFRRECNTQLLELGRPAWNKWKRDAWVLGHASEQGLSWEARAEGFTAAQGCGADAPAPPVPYGGGGMRLGARLQQQLLGLLRGVGGGGGGGAEDRAALAEVAPVPPSCIAMAADWCEVTQVVDLDWELQRRGLSAAQAAALLDSGLGLRLTVHVGSRADSLAGFSVGLLLDEGGGPGGEVPTMQSFVMRPSRHAFFSGRLRCGGRDAWQRFEYTVPQCPRGFRRALVLLRGRRAPNQAQPGQAEPGQAPPGQPLAGQAEEQLEREGETLPRFCGAKFAAAELVFA